MFVSGGNMRYIVLATFLALCLSISISLQAISIFEIQYTTNPGVDNTYPSPYTDEIVTVTGIVTATGYHASTGPKFFISDPVGGAWRGIFIDDSSHAVQLGDLVSVTGTVREYYGMTEIRQCSAINVISSNNSIPNPINLSSGQLASEEAYECCLTKIQNITCTTAPNTQNELYVDDGSGAAKVDDAFFSNLTPFPINSGVGVIYTYIMGIVDYSHGTYCLQPRNINDVQKRAPVLNVHKSWGRIKSIYK
jgi:hypothetical protein